jgi:hypothetical protein
MRNVFFSLFAIAVAAIAAMAATTAVLNTPVRVAATQQEPKDPSPAKTEGGAKPAAPPAETPPAPAAGGAQPAGSAAAGADTKEDDEPDKDPYEGIDPEELPPDLQYNADSSVSFPTNI